MGHSARVVGRPAWLSAASAAAIRDARLGGMGLGYVGLPLALEFAREGFRVSGFELDPKKVETLSSGASYIGDVPAEAVLEATRSGALTATVDTGELAACDVIHVCVPTPLTKTRDPDVSHIAAALCFVDFFTQHQLQLTRILVHDFPVRTIVFT